MNLVVIMLDSLRLDHLGCYGNNWMETPGIDSLAGESIVFDNAYAGGLPTLPARTELFTGQCTLPFRTWQPLGDDGHLVGTGRLLVGLSRCSGSSLLLTAVHGSGGGFLGVFRG